MPAVVIGADLRIIHANQSFTELFGADSLGRHFIYAFRHPDVIDTIERVTLERSAAQTQFLGKDGTRETTFDVHVRPVGDGVLVTLMDRTEVETVARMRSDFIANVSHELRTPLTSLMGFIETLRGAARDDAKARDRFLEIMAHEAGRMTRLVDELMTLSRLEAVERQRPSTEVSLNAVLKDASDALTPIAQAAGTALTLSTPPESVKVRGDAAQLQQVFTNLFENALKYGGGGKKVEISVIGGVYQPQLRQTGVEISVRDFGEGIESHHIARLTERFYRVDNHRSREVGGTGLGLAIVKHIVQRHRGRLDIKSTLGQGTIVRVFLPQ